MWDKGAGLLQWKHIDVGVELLSSYAFMWIQDDVDAI